MVTATRPPANGFIKFMRKVYNPLGFSKGYNAILWFIFDGALLGFILARFQYLNFWGIYCNPDSTTGNGSPGDCYYYTTFARNHIGLIIHLSTVIPAGFLAVFQFIPAIRHKALLYHRMAGYVIILLMLVSNGSAIAIANHAFGGSNAIRTVVGILAIITTVSLALAYYNVKRLQIEQHRAWMLRAWFYLGAVITDRIIQIIFAVVATKWMGDAQQYTVMPCAELNYINGGDVAQTYATYPECEPGNTRFRPDGMAIVAANFAPTSGTGDGTTVQAAVATGFASSLLLALVLHAIGVEIYLRLTPREAERLRRVSYEKQLERGYKNPGSAGLTVDRLGDAEPWMPPVARKSSGDTLALTVDVPDKLRDQSPSALPSHSR